MEHFTNPLYPRWNKFTSEHNPQPIRENNKVNILFSHINELSISSIKEFSIKANIPLNSLDKDSNSLIHHVIELDAPEKDDLYRLDLIKFLVNQNVSIDQPNKFNRTPLHLSCKKQYLEITKFLLSQNADINYKDNFGMTPIHYLLNGLVFLPKNKYQRNLLKPSKTDEPYIEEYSKLKKDIIRVLEGESVLPGSQSYENKLLKLLKNSVKSFADETAIDERINDSIDLIATQLSDNIPENVYQNVVQMMDLIKDNIKNTWNVSVISDIGIHNDEEDSWNPSNIPEDFDRKLIKNDSDEFYFKKKLDESIELMRTTFDEKNTTSFQREYNVSPPETDKQKINPLVIKDHCKLNNTEIIDNLFSHMIFNRIPSRETRINYFRRLLLNIKQLVDPVRRFKKIETVRNKRVSIFEPNIAPQPPVSYVTVNGGINSLAYASDNAEQINILEPTSQASKLWIELNKLLEIKNKPITNYACDIYDWTESKYYGGSRNITISKNPLNNQYNVNFSQAPFNNVDYLYLIYQLKLENIGNYIIDHCVKGITNTANTGRGDHMTATQNWCRDELKSILNNTNHDFFISNDSNNYLGYYAIKKLYDQKEKLDKATYFMELTKLFVTIQTGNNNDIDKSLDGELDELYYHLANTLKQNVKNKRQAFINSTKESFFIKQLIDLMMAPATAAPTHNYWNEVLPTLSNIPPDSNNLDNFIWTWLQIFLVEERDLQDINSAVIYQDENSSNLINYDTNNNVEPRTKRTFGKYFENLKNKRYWKIHDNKNDIRIVLWQLKDSDTKKI